MPKLKDLTGLRFGRLTVLKRADNVGKHTAWLCRCDCGNKKVVPAWNLVSGLTKSCGCFAIETKRKNFEARETHGQSYTRLYTVWISMKQRCFYEKHKHYKRYGGRGIIVCDEWKNDFTAFRDWALSNGYADNLSIDRIDVDGNYCPENCRWATVEEQNNNTSTNHFLTYNGETKSIAEWSKVTDIPKSTISNRIKRGWTVEQTLKKRR